jgi:hypothetical protein
MFLRKGLHGATSQKTKLFLESVLFPWREDTDSHLQLWICKETVLDSWQEDSPLGDFLKVHQILVLSVRFGVCVPDVLHVQETTIGLQKHVSTYLGLRMHRSYL